MKFAQAGCTLTSGGAEKIATEIGLYMKGKGHHVDYIILDRFSGSPYEANTMEKLGSAGISVFSMQRKPGSLTSGVAAVVRLAAFLFRNRYDIVHSHLRLTHLFVAFARLLNFNSFQQVVTVHSSGETWTKLSKALNRSSHIILCANHAKEVIHKAASKSVIENGIIARDMSISPEQRKKLRKSLGCGENSWLVLSVGNLIERKNYRVAIDALEKLIQNNQTIGWHYLICGEGPEFRQLNEYVEMKKLGAYVHIAGPRSDIPELLYCADCFLSVSKREGLPLAVLEAFFSGIPCVLSPIFEHQAMTEDVAACIVAQANTPSAISEAIHNLRQKKYERFNIMRKRKTALNKYSFDTMARKYEAFYQEMVK